MSFQKQKELESAYVMTTYGRKQVEFIRGSGMRLYDSDGKEYLDFLAGIGAVNLGHANPALAEALALQAKKLIQVGNYFYVEGRGELARDLSLLLNEGNETATHWKTFFANTGAEANEGAIKLARKYGKLHLNGAGTVLTANGSFHGRTLMTTAATAQEAKQKSFAPMPSGVMHFDPTHIENLAQAIELRFQLAKDTKQADLAPAAVLLECVQGESGVWPLGEAYLRDVRALTAERGMLLMIDEVQTGFYRTGRPFAFMHAGIRPDVVTMAKGIANGYPCAAFSATGNAAYIIEPGEHGSTFGGNPLAIAAARATLAEYAKLDLTTQVKRMGSYLGSSLAFLPHVTEVRGRGLMLGITIDIPRAAYIADRALERGVILNAIGDTTLRFLPPFMVSETEIDSLCIVLLELLEAQ